eukprot:Em0007g922a
MQARKFAGASTFWQVQQEGRVLFYPQVLGPRLMWRALRQGLAMCCTSGHTTPRPTSSIHSTTTYTNPNTELGKVITAGWIINDHINIMKAKIDLKAAFHLIPVRAVDWVHLGMDRTCLPFGLRSSLSLINNYADALHWIMASNCGAQLLHYLDDFLLVGPPSKDTSGTADRSWLSKHKATKWELLSLIEPDKTEVDSLQLFTNASGSLGFGTYFNGGFLPVLPGTKEMVTLFAAHLSLSLHSKTIRSHISRVPHTESAIRGIQRIEGPIHLRPTRLPLTLAMLGQMLRRLERAPLK